jgi:UDP-GlcNAc:undecaprenyl-phosphate/decaprenyl-phosphate GlcNAc-1-phosphate transferase
MRFPINVYVIAAIAAAIVSALALPLWRRWFVRFGLVDDPGHRKIHETAIPLAGGLSVFTGMLVPLLAGIAVGLAVHHSDTVNLFEYGLNRRAIQLLGIFTGALGMLLLGLADDWIELPPATKFGGQLIIALLVAASGVRITLFVPNILFSYAITMLWILTLVNAFNFMDNMNGLCAGLGVISAVVFALIAAFSGQYLVATIAFVGAGALLGFLPYNFPRATAFLGDGGSHLIGFLLAVLAILPHFYTAKHPQTWAVFKPLLVLAVPLADLCWVVIIRWRAGKPFYVGDNNHLSHRLVRRGLSKTSAVVLIWLIAAAVASIALL